jgi:endonuclease/exonuclease/phosphatase family metal-dependent hydrolase
LLPNIDAGEQRGVIEVQIKLADGHGEVLFFATHLDHRPGERERLASAEAINELAARNGNQPALLAGDLNATPDSKTLAKLASQWNRANEQPMATIPVGRPARQIDFVLYRPPDRWKVVEVKVLDEALASDHRAILAVLELLPTDPR